MKGPGARRVAGAVALALLGLGPAVLEAGGQAGRLPSPEPVVLLDAEGRLVGHVLGTSRPDLATVWLRVGDQSFVGTFKPDGTAYPPIQRGAGLVVFEAADCSGPSLLFDATLAAYGISPLFDPAGPGPGGRILGAAGPEEFKTIQAQWDNPNPGCNLLPAATLMVVAPTRTVLDPAALALPLRLH